MGIRTPWTLASDRVWERLIDRRMLWFFGGIARRDPGVDRMPFAVNFTLFMTSPSGRCTIVSPLSKTREGFALRQIDTFGERTNDVNGNWP